MLRSLWLGKHKPKWERTLPRVGLAVAAAIRPVFSVHTCESWFLGSSVVFFLVTLFLFGWSFPTNLQFFALSQPSPSPSKTMTTAIAKIDQNAKICLKEWVGFFFFKFCFIEHLLFASDCVKALGAKSKVIGFLTLRGCLLALFEVHFFRLRKPFLGFGLNLSYIPLSLFILNIFYYIDI